MKAVILCGGMGTRLKEETEYKPKPMVEIGEMPMIWHIMKIYSHFGISKFVLCLGYKGSMIKDYFFNYEMRNSDFTIHLEDRKINIHNQPTEKSWEITLAETGANAMTGSRVKRIEQYIDEDVFLLTYGDGLSNVNINSLLEFHRSHGKIGTVTGVHPPSRFGELSIENNTVVNFNEKPQLHSGGLISGGFFVFNKKFFKYLSSAENCILERDPMEKLASEGQLMVYKHSGFWQCMDTYRDFEFLNKKWIENKAEWKVW